ncbi:MAG: ATP-binding cassette domain-containing protein, partial [Chloroflexota bacterium]
MISENIFAVKQLLHGYDQQGVLNIDQLEIKRGEILSIIGPSGAGKSTLLRLLNFIEKPNEGTIQFDQKFTQVDIPLSQRRRITTVFQNPTLLKRSVYSNLRYGAALQGKQVSKDKLIEWVERLGLSGLENKSAKNLSAGEAQRVALARALLVKPDVLLLDEPTANLDPYNVRLIEEVVQEENQQNQTTIVLVTHNIFQAKRISQRT